MKTKRPGPYGAEAEYYNALATSYSPSNGPLQSVEELLLVRGVTPTLLFGADVNRNGVIDADEQQRFGIGVDSPGAFGWAAYLTVHGAEANRRRDGTLRVNVNQDDMETVVRRVDRGIGQRFVRQLHRCLPDRRPIHFRSCGADRTEWRRKRAILRFQ